VEVKCQANLPKNRLYANRNVNIPLRSPALRRARSAGAHLPPAPHSTIVRGVQAVPGSVAAGTIVDVL